MATLVVLAGRMIPTEEILKVSSRYLDWFSFYEFFFVKNPTNCPIIGLVLNLQSRKIWHSRIVAKLKSI